MIVRDVPYVAYVGAAVLLLGGFVIGAMALGIGEGELLKAAAIAVGLGVLFAVLSPITISTFDRRGNAYEVSRRGMLRSSVKSGPLTDVAGVYSDEALTDNSYRVVLMLNSGEQILLSRWWTESRRRSERVARRITEFLHALR